MTLKDGENIPEHSGRMGGRKMQIPSGKMMHMEDKAENNVVHGLESSCD